MSGACQTNKILFQLCTAKDSGYQQTLKASWIDTPLGPMVAIADETGLYRIEFADRSNVEHEVERLRSKTKAVIIPGSTGPIQSITQELEWYFAGTFTHFKTPLHLLGTPFQQLVWQTLMHIPYGTTRSYQAQAEAIGKKTACRAVANANGANPFPIIIPCHRIIHRNGDLGGYSSGLARKQWLIAHEKRMSCPSLMEPSPKYTRSS